MSIGRLPPCAPISARSGATRANSSGVEDMAFAHVDDAMRSGFAEADHRPLRRAQGVERGPASRRGGREMRRQQFFRLDPLALRGVDHAVGNEPAQAVLVGMLELASAADGKMSARRDGAMGPRRHRAIGSDAVARNSARHVTTRSRDAIAPRSDAQDGLVVGHRKARSAAPTARASSPAVKPGAASRAASW